MVTNLRDSKQAIRNVREELGYQVPNWQDVGHAIADALESLETRISDLDRDRQPPAIEIRHGEAGEVRARRKK
jgi:hypothetical protein